MASQLENAHKNVFTDPAQARYAGWLVVALMCFVAYLLRNATASGAVTDVDAINFGLAAFRFDVLSHQPHPPGYPGYVLFLKLLHLVWPSASPLDIARAGSQIAGVTVIVLSYTITRRVLGSRMDIPEPYALAAAGFAVIHPILWFYGGDGQSHSAEAVALLVLIRIAIAAKERSNLYTVCALSAAMALCAAIRPTIPLLGAPLLVWVLWRRSATQWVAAAVTGVVCIGIWYGAFIATLSDVSLYKRASRAVIGNLFIDNFSLLGGSGRAISRNLLATTIAASIAAVPLVCASSPRRGLERLLLLVLLAHLALFTLLFTAETGYFSAAAAIACLVPVTWPNKLSALHRARIAAAVVLSLLIFWTAPPSIPLAHGIPFPLPSFRLIDDTGSSQRLYRDSICAATGERPAVLLTDNPTTTTNRWMPLACDGLIVAQHVHDLELNRDLDNWLIYRRRGMDAVPPPIPLEPGEPAIATIGPVELVVIAPESRPSWRERIVSEARCKPTVVSENDPELIAVLVFPRQCLDRISVGAHVIELAP